METRSRNQQGKRRQNRHNWTSSLPMFLAEFDFTTSSNNNIKSFSASSSSSIHHHTIISPIPRPFRKFRPLRPLANPKSGPDSRRIAVPEFTPHRRHERKSSLRG